MAKSPAESKLAGLYVIDHVARAISPPQAPVKLVQQCEKLKARIEAKLGDMLAHLSAAGLAVEDQVWTTHG